MCLIYETIVSDKQTWYVSHDMKKKLTFRYILNEMLDLYEMNCLTYMLHICNGILYGTQYRRIFI